MTDELEQLRAALKDERKQHAAALGTIQELRSALKRRRRDELVTVMIGILLLVLPAIYALSIGGSNVVVHSVEASDTAPKEP